MRVDRILGLGASVLMLAGCGGERPELVALKIELHALKQELEFLRQQTEELDPRVRLAEQMALQTIDERDAPFRLDCVNHRPGVLGTRLATLTTVCEEVINRPGGYTIRMKIGNPTSGHLDGLRLTFYAGDGAERGRSEARIYHEASTSLPSGTWRSIEVDLAGVTPASLPELAVRAQIDHIVLGQR